LGPHMPGCLLPSCRSRHTRGSCVSSPLRIIATLGRRHKRHVRTSRRTRTSRAVQSEDSESRELENAIRHRSGPSTEIRKSETDRDPSTIRKTTGFDQNSFTAHEFQCFWTLKGSILIPIYASGKQLPKSANNEPPSVEFIIRLNNVERGDSFGCLNKNRLDRQILGHQDLPRKGGIAVERETLISPLRV